VDDGPDQEEVRRQLEVLRQSGVKAREAVSLIAESSGWAKNRVYQLWLEIGRRE
jgi:hypothetical protein